jgi:hypothetical protein
MFGRSLGSIVPRLIFCALLAIALWYRGQVAEDRFYIQYPGLLRLDVANHVSGIQLFFQVDMKSRLPTAGGFFGGAFEPKYRRALWRHFYFSNLGDLLNSSRNGIWIGGQREATDSVDVFITVPQALLGLLLFAIADLEASLHKRRRRHAPGLCQGCGYDVRENKGRCSECGTPIPTVEMLKAQATIKRWSRMAAGSFAIAFLAVHAAIQYTLGLRGHLGHNLRAVDAGTLNILQFPVHFRLDDLENFDPVLTSILGTTIVVNCLLWGWAVASAAWVALLVRMKFYRSGTSMRIPSEPTI